MKYEHVTVLKHQMVSALRLKKGDIAVDCTAGGGGHTAGLLAEVGPTGKVFAVDQDEAAIEHLSLSFAQEIAAGTVIVVHDRFSNIRALAEQYQIEGRVHGICADVGISSIHVDDPERGFSFQKDGPLAMNMSRRFSTVSAADVVNTYPLEELVRIFRAYGEEREAHKIARAIVNHRASALFTRTSELADLINKITPYKFKGKKHPATRVFQALRIEVNHELDELEKLLQDGFSILSPLGRMAIISFHSLEDRLVKHCFRKLAGLEGDVIPKNIPLAAHELTKINLGTIVRPFPINPEDDEVDLNVRARSAKLRVIEKN